MIPSRIVLNTPAELRELLSIVGQRQRMERLRVSVARVKKASGAMCIQSDTGMQIICLCQLTAIARERRLFDFDRLIDADETVRKQRRPYLIAETLKIPSRSLSSIHENPTGRTMI